MFDELGPYLARSKTNDLLKRIEHEDPDQSLPAEYELALACAVSKVAHLEIEKRFGAGVPDIFSSDLFPGGPAAIDVIALSDKSLGGEAVMTRAANIINAEATKYAKDALRHLYYEFLEESGVLPADRYSQPFTRYFRRRRITRNFAISNNFKIALESWLRTTPPSDPLRWEDEHIGVVITWKDYVHPQMNTFSSMPAVCYDVRDNPLYEKLKDKARQLKGVPAGTLRGVFVGDAGCSLLRDVRRISRGAREVSGEQIIKTFLARNNVDFVVVFVPRRASEYGLWQRDNPRIWYAYSFGKSLVEDDFCKIERLVSKLPLPYLHGYQARSWHQQRMFDPQGKGHYLPAHYTGRGGKSEMKISARGLQEFLAGRIDREDLRRRVTGEHNFFETALARGKTISNVRFESSGIDRDDDYVIFEFKEDAAASPLKAPEAR